MPHHYWPIGVNAVEELPINISMPTRVMAVNKNRFIVWTVSREGCQNIEEIGAGRPEGSGSRSTIRGNDLKELPKAPPGVVNGVRSTLLEKMVKTQAEA